MEKKSSVKHKQVKKLTPDDLRKITGGKMPWDTRDCTGPGEPTCLAYIVVK